MPKTTKIRQSAKGESCTARIPGVCSNRTDTTVFAHLNGAGIGRKSTVTDINGKDFDIGAYCCFECHSWLDGGYANAGFSRIQRDAIHATAVVATLPRLVEKGLITAS